MSEWKVSTGATVVGVVGVVGVGEVATGDCDVGAVGVSDPLLQDSVTVNIRPTNNTAVNLRMAIHRARRWPLERGLESLFLLSR